MSHVEEVKVDCQELSMIEAAAKRLGGEFMRGQRTHAWWGSWSGDWRGERSAFAQGRDPKTFGQCEHAIRMKGRPGVNGERGPWEIGVVRSGDGYAFLYDNYGPAGKELEKMFGVDMALLKDETAAEISMSQLIADGFSVSRVDQDGQIVIDAMR